MRNGACALVALLLGGCTSHTTSSLADARHRFLEAQADYQECLNSAIGETIGNCEPKRLNAKIAEQAYKDAMSNGTGNP